ncbi:MAG: hypothetical protein CVU44_01345 [Chloroflexi bacterium HGW-Chloroflexi-6]|nr:MAG: hypothetical protein CVU44_01345 [Chloroflexi bacterium HGW-Chloroflexi-6]
MMKPTYMKALFVLSLVLIVAVFGVLVAAPTQNVVAADTYQEGVETCNTCHTQAYTPWSASKHNSGNVSCLVCHKLAQGEGAHPDLKYTVETEEVTCAVCHTDVVGADIAGQVALSQHGQIGLKCISCHEPHSQGPKLATGSTIVCDNCHRKQMETTLKSTHVAAGLSCVNCHMGPENSHTLKVAGETCAGCHDDIHKANRILNAGMEIRLMATPAAVFEKAGESTEPVAEPKQGGIQLPSWTLIVVGLFIGGIGTWALIGRDPGPPVK